MTEQATEMSAEFRPVPLQDIEFRANAIHIEKSPVGLVGSRCVPCGAQYFPQRQVCAACLSFSMERVALGGGGEIYSYTTVHVSSSRPTPYTLGYIDLWAGPRVLATIRTDGSLRTGQSVQLVVNDDGSDWWFTPSVEAEGDQ